MRYVVAIYTEEGLQTWEGFAVSTFQQACRQAAAHARDGHHTLLFELERVPLEGNDLCDWLDSELILAHFGMHDPRLTVFVEYPANKEAS